MEETAKLVEELLSQHGTTLRARILLLCRCFDDMEEIYQNVCLTLLEKIEDLRDSDGFPHWAFQIAWFRIKEFYRRRKQAPRLLDHPENIPLAASMPFSTSTPRIDALEQCLGQLAAPHRRLLEARYSDHRRSWQEIATKLNKSVEAVTTTCSRLRKKLQDCVNARLT